MLGNDADYARVNANMADGEVEISRIMPRVVISCRYVNVSTRGAVCIRKQWCTAQRATSVMPWALAVGPNVAGMSGGKAVISIARKPNPKPNRTRGCTQLY